MNAWVRTRSFRVVLVLTLAVVVFAFRSVLWSLVVVPIGWLAWALWRLLAAFDRGLIWFGVILVCAALALRIVPLSRGHDDLPDVAWQSDSNASDRTAHWQSLVAAASSTHAGRSALLAVLRNLAATVAEGTKLPAPPVSPPQSRYLLQRLLTHVVPAYKARADQREIDDLLSWMEIALEIRHES